MDVICNAIGENTTKPIVFFDLETTGLNTTVDRIVQVGVIKVYPDTRKYVETSFLVNPLRLIPQEATDVHHITNEMVANEQVFSELAVTLYNFIKDSDIAGFNSDRFDVIMLSEEFNRCGIAWPLEDTKLIDVLKVEQCLNPRSLVALHTKYYNEDFSTDAHDALNDVKATINVFGKQLCLCEFTVDELIKKSNENIKKLDLAGFIGINENGEAFYTFGKNNGKLVKQDLNYAKWMLTADFPVTTKRVIAKLLTA
jgi:DNA polymerase-3 subunit epsilon